MVGQSSAEQTITEMGVESTLPLPTPPDTSDDLSAQSLSRDTIVVERTLAWIFKAEGLAPDPFDLSSESLVKIAEATIPQNSRQELIKKYRDDGYWTDEKQNALLRIVEIYLDQAISRLQNPGPAGQAEGSTPQQTETALLLAHALLANAQLKFFRSDENNGLALRDLAIRQCQSGLKIYRELFEQNVEQNISAIASQIKTPLLGFKSPYASKAKLSETGNVQGTIKHQGPDDSKFQVAILKDIVQESLPLHPQALSTEALASVVSCLADHVKLNGWLKSDAPPSGGKNKAPLITRLSYFDEYIFRNSDPKEASLRQNTVSADLSQNYLVVRSLQEFSKIAYMLFKETGNKHFGDKARAYTLDALQLIESDLPKFIADSPEKAHKAIIDLKHCLCAAVSLLQGDLLPTSFSPSWALGTFPSDPIYQRDRTESGKAAFEDSKRFYLIRSQAEALHRFIKFGGASADPLLFSENEIIYAAQALFKPELFRRSFEKYVPKGLLILEQITPSLEAAEKYFEYAIQRVPTSGSSVIPVDPAQSAYAAFAYFIIAKINFQKFDETQDRQLIEKSFRNNNYAIEIYLNLGKRAPEELNRYKRDFTPWISDLLSKHYDVSDRSRKIAITKLRKELQNLEPHNQAS